MKGLNKLFRFIIDLLYPKVICPVCRNIEPGLCIPCRDSFEIYGDGGLGEGVGVSLYRHKEEVNLLISNFKKKMMFSAGDTMADLIYEKYKDELKDFDVIVFAPSSKESRKKLGFDHGKYLASALSRKTGVPAVSLFEPADKEQKVLDREERKTNAKKIRLKKAELGGLKGKKAVLIDDVFTTGSTVLQCTQLLEELCMECRYLTFSRV